MRLVVRARVYPTENEKKVEAAIKKLFEVKVRKEGEYLVGNSTSRECLKKIYTLLRSQGILDSAREELLKNTRDNQLNFSLNKQAACAGAVNFATPSYLGSIHVTITACDIAELIDWLVPKGKH